MKITKKISMVRHMARIDREGKEIFDKEVWVVRKNPPTCRYYKIEVTIAEIEDRFKNERGKEHV